MLVKKNHARTGFKGLTDKKLIKKSLLDNVYQRAPLASSNKSYSSDDNDVY